MRKIFLIGISLLTTLTLIGQHYEFSSGLYRIGYEDGTNVHVVSDVYSHDPLGKYDITTGAFDPFIVAAADGWIRWIEESHNGACHPAGNGDPCCWWNNNFVVIEHPNGEWSQYTHIQQNSATDVGIALNDWVTVGTAIGIEGNVGCSTEDHLHLEVSRPFDPAFPFDTIGGFLNDLGEMLIPVIGGIQPFLPWLSDGNDRNAGPCDDNCAANMTVNGSVGNNGEYIARADDYVVTTSNNDVIFSNGSTTQFRAGDYVTLNPGFHVQAGAKFQAILRGCNQQN